MVCLSQLEGQFGPNFDLHECLNDAKITIMTKRLAVITSVPSRSKF